MNISVVVPFHNEEQYIERCIQALLAQNYPRDQHEIIMIDNNSTDKSRDIVKQYGQIKLLSQPRQGSYAARNLGVSGANGALLAFTDSDCAPHRDWLKEIAIAMRSSGFQVLLGYRHFGSESPALSMLQAYESEKSAHIFSSDAQRLYYGYTNNMTVRKTVFENLGSFLEIPRGGDTNLVRRVLQKFPCESIAYSDKVSVRHLEITSLAKHFRKQLIYGWNNQRNRKIGSGGLLSRDARTRVFENTIRREHYGLARSIALFLILAAGVALFNLGKWSALVAAQRRNGRNSTISPFTGSSIPSRHRGKT